MPYLFFLSAGRKKTDLTLEKIQRVIGFIRSYAEDHGILLPGRIPGFKRDDVIVLPSHLSKAAIHRQYEQLADQSREEDLCAVSYDTFRRLWKQLMPHVVIAKPMSDLCLTCQKNSTLIMKAAGKEDIEKSAALQTAVNHIERAQTERASYVAHRDNAKDEACAHAITCLGRNQPCSFNGSSSYSFDFAQQVHYPSNPMQPGPIYFKTPKNVEFLVYMQKLGRGKSII